MDLLRSRIELILVGVFLLGLAGCGGGTGTGGTFGSAETQTFEGWENYKKDSIEQAEKLFQSALSLDPSFSEAHNGLGWVNFHKAGQEASEESRTRLLNNAKVNFEKATTANSENVDAWTGRAGVALAQNNWEEARDAANQVLNLDERYFSSHDNIDFRDIRLILAEAYFFLGAFVATQEIPKEQTALYHLDWLDPGYKDEYVARNLTHTDLIRKIEDLQKKLHPDFISRPSVEQGS